MTKEEKRAKQREYEARNKEKISLRRKKQRLENLDFYRERDRATYQKRKERVKANLIKFKKENPEYYRNYYKEYRKILKNKIAANFRRRLNLVVRKESKSKSVMELIGCTFEELVKHLESKFRDGMTWNNYGTTWHVDHKLPCAKFNLELPEEQEKCFHYSNLQPLLAYENLSKGKKIIE